jgi:hypothetical protein
VPRDGGDREGEGRPGAGRGSDRELPAVEVDHPPAHGEPDPGSRVAVRAVQPTEHGEDPLLVRRVDADAVIGDRDGPARRQPVSRGVARPGLDHDPARPLGVPEPHGVGQQVLEHLHQEGLVAPHGGQGAHVDGRAGLVDGRAEVGDGVCGHPVEVDLTEPDGVGAEPAVLEQALDELSHPLDGVAGLLEVVHSPVVERLPRAVAVPDEVDVAADHPQRFGEVVGGHGGELLEVPVGALELGGAGFEVCGGPGGQSAPAPAAGGEQADEHREQRGQGRTGGDGPRRSVDHLVGEGGRGPQLEGPGGSRHGDRPLPVGSGGPGGRAGHRDGPSGGAVAEAHRDPVGQADLLEDVLRPERHVRPTEEGGSALGGCGIRRPRPQHGRVQHVARGLLLDGPVAVDGQHEAGGDDGPALGHRPVEALGRLGDGPQVRAPGSPQLLGGLVVEDHRGLDAGGLHVGEVGGAVGPSLGDEARQVGRGDAVDVAEAEQAGPLGQQTRREAGEGRPVELGRGPQQAGGGEGGGDLLVEEGLELVLHVARHQRGAHVELPRRPVRLRAGRGPGGEEAHHDHRHRRHRADRPCPGGARGLHSSCPHGPRVPFPRGHHASGAARHPGGSSGCVLDAP